MSHDRDRIIAKVLAGTTVTKAMLDDMMLAAINGEGVRTYFDGTAVKVERVEFRDGLPVEPDLLPCPFCGGEAGFGTHWADDYFVNCTDCLAATNHLTETRATKEEAAAAWNRRVKG